MKIVHVAPVRGIVPVEERTAIALEQMSKAHSKLQLLQDNVLLDIDPKRWAQLQPLLDTPFVII
jgi:hypothetical protein